MDRFDLFRIFIQVMDSASFSRAAEVSGMSRATVSVAVQELEARLGVRLLVNRRPKRTPYRRPKGTPFVEQRDGYDGCTVRAGCGVGRA